LETKEKKETAKPLHTFTSLHGRRRIRFAFSSAKNKNNKNNNRNKQEETKKKVQFPATRLDLFKQDRKNMRANLYVLPDIFFDQEGYFGKWKSGDSHESEAWIAGLVDSRGGGGGSDSKCCWCDRQTEPGKDRTSLLVSSGDGAQEAPGTLVPALRRNPRRGLQG